MSGWDSLHEELNAWEQSGRRADLWWRDDDAGTPCAALDRLLALAAAWRLPLALAVIPAAADPALAERLATDTGVQVLQHGFAHQNHAAAGEKKCELAAERGIEILCDELSLGWARLTDLLPDRLQPVLVPPWNRIAPDLVDRLPALGYQGFSAYGPRPAPDAAPGLRQVNSHVDIMQWKPPRGFVGEAAALELLVARLKAQRDALDSDPAPEPIGLLTHHLAHDEAAWRFLEWLFEQLAAHSAVDWLTADAAFGLSADKTAKGAPA